MQGRFEEPCHTAKFKAELPTKIITNALGFIYFPLSLSETVWIQQIYLPWYHEQQFAGLSAAAIQPPNSCDLSGIIIMVYCKKVQMSNWVMPLKKSSALRVAHQCFNFTRHRPFWYDMSYLRQNALFWCP